MTDDRLPLAELAAKSGDTDVLRLIAENLLQLIMEFEREEIDPVDRFQRRMTSTA